ncbi:MAG: DUF1015 domain-containing protein [Bdellovibrionota bacterium]
MAKVYPFRGIHYDTGRIQLGDVITPPYDVITPEQGRRFREQSPYNFAHLILPKDKSAYVEVGARLRKWKSEKILVQDPIPHFYLYQQRFTTDKEHSRNVLLCSVELADFSEGVVLPHELTHGRPVEDRLNLLRETQSHLSAVFAMVRDENGILAGHYESVVYDPPELQGKTNDGIVHSLWRLPVELNTAIAGFFESQPLYIVDGHHRYTSALAYAREAGTYKGDKESSRMFFAVANAYDPALQVFPTHRLIRHAVMDVKTREALEQLYRVHPVSRGELDRFVKNQATEPSFILCYQSEFMLCTPKNPQREEWGSLAKLSVTWSDNVFLKEVCKISEHERGERISYFRDEGELLQAMQNTDAGIFLPTPGVEDIPMVADEGRYMPQKSTYFFPKLAAGILLRSLT